jgi:predicted porin
MSHFILAALAVVAASGAAFAQSSVSLTGKLRFAYGTAKAVDGAKTTGVGVTDGDWNIAAVEDLGGGLKAGAAVTLLLMQFLALLRQTAMAHVHVTPACT